MWADQMDTKASSACVGNCAWGVGQPVKVARDKSGEEGNVSGSVPLAFMFILSLNFETNLMKRYLCLHFTSEPTEAQRR